LPFFYKFLQALIKRLLKFTISFLSLPIWVFLVLSFRLLERMVIKSHTPKWELVGETKEHCKVHTVAKASQREHFIVRAMYMEVAAFLILLISSFVPT
jgi:hypothetical protein